MTKSMEPVNKPGSMVANSKECTRRASGMVKVGTCGRTAASTQDHGSMEPLPVMDEPTGLMDADMMASGSTIRNTERDPTPGQMVGDIRGTTRMGFGRALVH